MNVNIVVNIVTKSEKVPAILKVPNRENLITKFIPEVYNRPEEVTKLLEI